MALTYASVRLSNPSRPQLRAMDVHALVDTGSVYLCVPEHVALQLELTELEKREVALADGRKHLRPYAGPVRIEFQGRNAFTGALILGDEVLLGAIPLEDMDLVVHPLSQELTVNPESPNIPSGKVKRAAGDR
jgi:clan AA aspartic protease